MTMVEEMILSGFISKAINEIVDIPENLIKKAIKDADKKRRDKNPSIETRIYQVTIDSINKFTNDMYKDQDDLYDAAESMIRGFKNSNNNVEAVRAGLKMLVSQVTSETCEDFLKTLQHEICMDENDILYKEIILNQGGQTFEAVREGFSESNKNDEETHKRLGYVIEGIDNIKEKIDGIGNDKVRHYEIPIKNRADEYAEKWDKNVFLNEFNEEDENAGINIKLREIYVEECLPHYIWKNNTKTSDKLRNLLTKYIINNNDRKMLLILGQAGIGKSTLITWIMANLMKKKEDILVYQFATDLYSIDWQSKNVLNDIFSVIGLEYDEIENKTLILDGFDEIYTGSDRERILNKLNQELKRWNTLKSFSIIITCRENYVYNLQNIDCDYIVLQVWDNVQIENFCRTYWEKCGNDISADKIQRILENEEVFGIPLILYMILALNVDVEESSSMVEIYDQIFSLEKGVIYDRCYDSEHRINLPEIKEHIYRISQKMAFWMFENNTDKAFISQEKFEEICDNEMSEYGEKGEDIQSDTLIGNFFKLKHSEGKGTDELQFVHRSIYEYFVTVYFFDSIHKLKSKEEVAGKLGELLKDGHLSKQILEFIKCKFDGIKKYNMSDITREIFNIMLQDGMTYHIGKPVLNVLECEMKILYNMLEVVYLWNKKLGKISDKIVFYLQYTHLTKLKLRGADLLGVDLRGVYLCGADLERTDLSIANLEGAYLRKTAFGGTNLRGAYLEEADLRGAYLVETDLREAYLRRADLREAYLLGACLERVKLRGINLEGTNFLSADLSEVDLSEVDLSKAKLKDVNLDRANLNKTIFNEEQVDALHEKYDLSESCVLLSETDKIISYQEYSISKQKIK